MKKLVYLGVFAVGALIGSAVTWKLVENKYKQIAQEEIDSVKSLYLKKIDEHSEEINDLKKTNDKLKDVLSDNETNNHNGYKKIVESLGYVKSEENIKNKYEEVGTMPVIIEDDKPCVIHPDEFGDDEEYEIVYLTLYADETLADYEDPIEDIDYMVGYDNLKEMGKYEDDVLHIRNDRHQCYYEITADSRTFDEVWNSGD